MQKPVDKAIDWVVKGALKLAKPLVKAVTKGVEWVKRKAAAGKAWVKGKYEAGKAYVKKKYEAAKGWVKGKADSAKSWIKGKAEAAKELFSLRRRFTAEGEAHSLYTAGPSPDLTVASVPTNLATHPDAAVRSAHAGYRTAVDAAKTPNAKRTAASRRLPAIIAALRTWFTRTKSDDPQASAPGIGNIAAYRNQPSSLHRQKIPMWAMIREHVIPRAFGNAVFEALHVRGVPAGKTDYRAQTTIMIYKGAAEAKTNLPGGDNALTRQLKGEIEKLMVEFDKTKGSAKGRAVTVVFKALVNILAGYVEEAADRTARVVAAENKQNRARRGPRGKPEAETPDKGRIKSAARDQVDDIDRQLRARLR